MTPKTGSQRSLQPPQALWGPATTPPLLGTPRQPQGDLGRGRGGQRPHHTSLQDAPGPWLRLSHANSASPHHSRTRSTFPSFSPSSLHAFEGMFLTVSPELLSLLKWGGDSNVLWGKEPGLGLASTSHIHRDFQRTLTGTGSEHRWLCPLDTSLRLSEPRSPSAERSPLLTQTCLPWPRTSTSRRSWNTSSPRSPPPLATRPSSQPVTFILAWPQYRARGIIPDQGLKPAPCTLRAASQPLDLQGSPGLWHSRHEPLGPAFLPPGFPVSSPDSQHLFPCLPHGAQFSWASDDLKASCSPTGTGWARILGESTRLPCHGTRMAIPTTRGQLSKGPPTAVGPPGLDISVPSLSAACPPCRPDSAEARPLFSG